MNITVPSIDIQSIPDEICLRIEVIGCMHNCKGCHWLGLDIETMKLDINAILDKYKQKTFSTILFMGEGLGEWKKLYNAISVIKKKGYKTALYTGCNDIDDVDKDVVSKLDYLKVGSWKEELGGLDSETTNQRLYRIPTEMALKDITYKMRKN